MIVSAHSQNWINHFIWNAKQEMGKRVWKMFWIIKREQTEQQQKIKLNSTTNIPKQQFEISTTERANVCDETGDNTENNCLFRTKWITLLTHQYAHIYLHG